VPDAPTPAIPRKLDYTAIQMWHLRMNSVREEATQSWRPARRVRWRPGRTW
jgi:hypothetical protein